MYERSICFKEIHFSDEMVATISSGFTGDKVVYFLFNQDLLFTDTAGGG